MTSEAAEATQESTIKSGPTRKESCLGSTHTAFAPERSMGKLSYFHSALSTNAIDTAIILQQEPALNKLDACAHDSEVRIPASEVSFAVLRWESCLDSLRHESLTLWQLSRHVCCTPSKLWAFCSRRITPSPRCAIASCDCTRFSCSISTFRTRLASHACIL